MESIREIFKIGLGPSSSHTMGPHLAAASFFNDHKQAHSFKVTLYGSLAATGKGHMTDRAIEYACAPRHTAIFWKPDLVLPLHPNGMEFEALDKNGRNISTWRVYSVGGGTIRDEKSWDQGGKKVIPLKSMSEILELCLKQEISLWEYIFSLEKVEDYLVKAWAAMQETLRKGLQEEGILPGELRLGRKAPAWFSKAQQSTDYLRKANLLFSYALACAEENAAGGQVVTAPTCGSCGVVPAVLYFLGDSANISGDEIIKALATAGLIGNIARTNASISGAEVGCQGEIGVACAMAAGAATQILGGSLYQIEYAAEMSLEHHLGLTCDPIAGLVQIPCIERNAMAAARALDCAAFSLNSDGRHRVSYDEVVNTMKATGRDLKNIYRETSRGGLAAEYEHHISAEDKLLDPLL